jgi:enoyl-CoA hydratase/carnithine racemase
MASELKSTSVGRTLVLTISNPELGNALSPEITSAGIEALSVAENNPEIRSVLIRGDGLCFCATGNLRRLDASRQQPADFQKQIVETLHNLIEAIRFFPKPVVAAVEGSAQGDGFSLALACDFIVAARDAVFVMDYCNVALSPDAGGSWSLVQALPRQLATQILMCGNKVSAQVLHTHGLVNQLADPGAAQQEALSLCEQLNQRAPNALSSIKELINEASQGSLTAQLARERDAFVTNLHHTNAGIGINAFLNKTPPRY